LNNIAINELLLIKEYVRQVQYQYNFEVTPSAKNRKTHDYMLKKALTRELLAGVILHLNKSDCFKPKERDKDPRYDKGWFYFFHKNYFGDNLYIKVMVPDDPGQMIIFSIHEEGLH